MKKGPEPEIRRKRKTALTLMNASYIALAAAFVRCMLLKTVWDPLVLALLGVFLALCVSSLTISVKYWKCPHCGQWLELKKGEADKTGRCPRCKKEL